MANKRPPKLPKDHPDWAAKRAEIYDGLDMDALRWAVERMARGVPAVEVADSVSVYVGRTVAVETIKRLDFDVYPCYSHELRYLWDRTREESAEQCGSVMERDYRARKLLQVIERAERAGDHELMLRALRVGSQMADGKLSSTLRSELSGLSDEELADRLQAAKNALPSQGVLFEKSRNDPPSETPDR